MDRWGQRGRPSDDHHLPGVLALGHGFGMTGPRWELFPVILHCSLQSLLVRAAETEVGEQEKLLYCGSCSSSSRYVKNGGSSRQSCSNGDSGCIGYVPASVIGF